LLGNFDLEIDYFQHPDSIWTWKSNQRGQKASLWIPYLDHVEKIKGNRWQFVYNGGELDVDLKSIDTIMLYGASGTLPVSFLDQLGILRIPMIVHRRNIDSPTLVLPAPRSDAADVMGKQIIFRQNQIKATYVARILVRCRFRAVEDHLIISNRAWARFNKIRNLDRIRNMEAQWAKRYWKTYYSEVGLPDGFRRESNPVSQALNACSFFLYGVVLRWILVHRMSPQHGFLHRPTDYPSLVYDLIEPYRYIAENAVKQVAAQMDTDDENLTKHALETIKRNMEDTVYVPATRQFVRRKNLLHGAILSLRAWLLGEMPRLVFPTEGVRIGGRPPKVSYTLPGERIANRGRKVAPS
jgi:CRISPR/Cas system-associated endonuclease Cas1